MSEIKIVENRLLNPQHRLEIAWKILNFYDRISQGKMDDIILHRMSESVSKKFGADMANFHSFNKIIHYLRPAQESVEVSAGSSILEDAAVTQNRCVSPALATEASIIAFHILETLVSTSNFFDRVKLGLFGSSNRELIVQPTGFREGGLDVHFKDYYTALKPFQVTFKGEPCPQP